jgi:MinD-like ATPase involved in chromosome partitioning or flagellar assembly
MIYSDAFDQLPAAAKRAIYARLWEVLSGAERAPKYARLSAADRDRIIEILRETKRDFAIQAPRTKD